MGEERKPERPPSLRKRRAGGWLRPDIRAPDERAGFALGPILYLLALIGIGAGILFSGYSQVLRSNIQITQDMDTKNDLNGSATTLSATSVLGSTDNTILCPPQGGSATANCSGAPVRMETFAAAAGSPDASRLPVNYANAGVTNAATGFEAGVFAPGAGVKQLDPYGHFYIYCRRENAISDGTTPSIMIVSAGPDGVLNTTCSDTSAQGDDQIVSWPAPTAVNRSAIWQTTSGSNGTQAQFGEVGHQLYVDALGNITVPGSLAVTGTSTFGGTGTFTGAVTAPNFVGSVSGTTGVFTGAVSAGGGFLGDLTGNVTGGTISGSTGAFASDLSVGGNTTLAGTLGVSGAATLSSTLGVSGKTTLNNALDVTSTATFGIINGEQVFISPQGLVIANSGFSGNLSGDVSGNVTGNLTGNVTGNISGSTGAFSTSLTVGGVSNVDILANGSATFSGTVAAANFSGNASSATTATNVTGIVSLANGGTGYAASSNNDLLTYLGVLSGGYLNMALVANQSVTDAMLTNVVSPGTYTQVTVNAEGRVTAGATSSSVSDDITDGSGDSVTANSGDITFLTSGGGQDVIDANGDLGLGTLTPQSKLDVNGDVRIDGASGTSRQLQFTTSNSERWVVSAGSDAEGSGNTGSSFVITGYDNTGNPIGNALVIARSNLAATFTGSVSTPLLIGGSGLFTGTVTSGSISSGSGLFTGTVTAANISGGSGYFSGTVTAGNFSGNITGNISLADGSVGSPGLFFTNEINTGLFRPGTNQFGFAVGGAETMELETVTGATDYLTITPATSGGAPIIGVAGNANAGLNFNSAGSGNITLTPGSTGNIVVPSGNVGIGTATVVGNYVLTASGGINSSQNSTTAAGIFGTNASIGGSVLTGAGAGMYGAATGAGNTAAAIFGINGSGSGNAIYGLETTTSGAVANGAGAAIFGSETGAGNTAPVGYFSNSSTTGANYGVVGTVASTDNGAAAMYGVNTGGSGAGFGGYFASTSSGAGTGVYGTITGANNTGYAGFFANTSTTGVNYAGYFTNNSSTGWTVYAANGAPNYFGGKVGIGVVPANTLDVNGALAVGSYAGSAVPNNDLVISGNVGIGTATPGDSLDIGTKSDAVTLPGNTTADIGRAPAANGMIRYNSGVPAVEAYIAGSWQSLLAGTSTSSTSIFLGSSTTANPQIAGEPTSGFYTSGLHQIAVESNGVEVMQWNTLASGTDYLAVLPGAVGTAVSLTATGGASDANAAILFKSQGSGNITFAPGTTGNVTVSNGNLNIAQSSAALQLGGANILTYPALGTDSGGLAIGPGALAAQTATGATNLAVGNNALALLTSGTENTALGIDALGNTGTGDQNTAVGKFAAYASTGSGNTALGYLAMDTNTIGANNVAVGIDALQLSTTASQNTAVGAYAGSKLNTGNGSSTFLGYNAGGSVTSGGSNTVIGALVASTTLTTGSSNILIGTSNAVDTPANNTSNFLNIGNLIYGKMVGVNIGIGGVPSDYAVLDLYSQDNALVLPGNTSGTGGRPLAGHELDGMIRYNQDTPGVEAFVNGAWQTLLADTTTGTSSNLYLGSQTTANPQIYGEPTSGFYTPAANTIAVETGGNTALTITSTGSVGIGTTTPGYPLDIQTNTNADSIMINVRNNNSGTGATARLAATNNLAQQFVFGITSNGYTPYGVICATCGFLYHVSSIVLGADNSAGYIAFGTGAGIPEAMRITSSGSVGIGTTNPSNKLDVAGNVHLDQPNSTMFVNTTTNSADAGTDSYLLIEPDNGSGNSTGGIEFLNGSGGVEAAISGNNANELTTVNTWSHNGVGDFVVKTNTGTIRMQARNATDVALTAQGATSQTADLFEALNSTGTVLDEITSSGSIGIGTTSPQAKLDVNGGIDIGGHNAISVPANDATLGSLAVGPGALGNLASVTTGWMTAVGYGALASDTTGVYNTAVGYDALALTGTGSSNTALGEGAGASITGGSSNIVIGALAASTTLSTGSSNILIGNGVDTAAGNTSNWLNIGNLIYGNLGGGYNVAIGGPPNAYAVLDLSSQDNALILPGNTSGTGGRPASGHEADGMIRYNQDTPGVEAFVNGAWQTLLADTTTGTSSNLYLGSQTTANPQIYGEPTSGFYTPAANTIAVETGGTTALTITSTQSIGIGTTAPGTTLDVTGAERLSGSTTDNFISPLGSSIPTKINIPLFDPGAFGQILAMGLPSSAQSTARVITVLDARTVAHQPTVAVLSPDENQIMGFSFDGSNTTGYIKSTIALGLMANGAEAMHIDTSGNVGIGTTSMQPGYIETVNGSISATQASNNNAAVYGASSVETGSVSYGGYFTATATNITGYGAYGSVTGPGNSGYGIYGANTGASNTGFGGYFTNTATTAGYALFATSSTMGAGYGVASWLPQASNTGYAGSFTNSGTGVSYGAYGSVTGPGNSGYGIYGANTGASNTGFGGYFTNTATTAGYALFATSSTMGAGYGVASWLPQASNTGYAGSFTNSGTGVSYGIYASAIGAGNSGYAGYFSNTSTTTGYAGYFNGAVNITGPLNLTGGCTGCVAGSSAINLGSVTTANPAISGHVTSGFYTPDATNQVAVESNGIEVEQWNTLASGTDYLSLTPGKSGSPFSLTTTGSANAALSLSTLGSGNITLTPGTSGNIITSGNVGIGTTSPGALLDIGLAGTTTGTMRLEGGSSGYVQLQPSGAAGNWTMTLPGSAGTNGYVLSTNGSGVTSWISASSIAGGTPLSSITSASAPNTIDSGANAQVWEWGTLSSGTAMTLTTSSMQGGTLLSLKNTAAASTSTGDVLSVTNATTGTGYGIYSAMTGHGNTGYAGYFTNTDTGADANYGIYGSSASTGVGVGVYGTSASLTGYGVYGHNSYNSGPPYGYSVGVYGDSANAAFGGWGVEGVGPLGYGGGVYGTTASGSGTGVKGENTSTGGLVYGVYGTVITTGVGYGVVGYEGGNTNSGYGTAGYETGFNNTGYAVYGLNNAGGNGNGAVNYGGYFETTTTAAGYGVKAVESGAGNTGYAGYFANTATSSVNYGVYATTASTGTGYGIYASITGASNTGYAVFAANATTTAGYGVYGAMTGAGNVGYAGAFANTSATGANVGVIGQVASANNGAVGVQGVNGGGSGNGTGVQGVTNSTGAGMGVMGVNQGAANSGYAGYFVNTATSGANYGVYGTNASASGYGGYFTNSNGGYALYANGNTYLSTTTTVGGALNATATVNLSAAVNVTGLASGTVAAGSYLGLNASNQVVLGAGGSSVALNSITAATGSSTIDSGANAQVWKWGTLTSGTAMTLTTSSMTGGTLLSLQNTAAAATATGNVLSITNASTGAGYGVYSAMTGHGNSGYAGYFANTDTGADVNYGVYGTNASASGYGGYFTNTSTGWALAATGTSYFNGNVGIGTTAPAALLTVQSTSAQMQLNYDSSHNVPFSVSSGGNLTIIPTGGSVNINGGTSNQVLEVSNTYNGLDEIMYVNNSQAAAAGVGSAFDFAGTSGNNVQARIASAWNGAANTDAYMSFWTRTAGNPTEYMRITSTGSVGIGTAAPGALLDIGLAGTTTGTMRLEGGASGYVQLQPSGAAGSWTMTLPGGAGSNGYVLSTNGSGVTSWVANGAGSTPALSSLTAATGPNTIDSGANAQVWEWGTLSSGTAMTLTTSSMQGGTLLSLQNTAAASTSTGDVLSVTNASTGTGYGIYSAMTGHGNTGAAGYFANTDTGADVNYGVYGITSSNGTGAGVYGECDAANCQGVNGQSVNGYGVSGYTTGTGSVAAIWGEIAGTANTGYAGYFKNTATSGANYGVWSQVASTTGYAGYFTNPATTGVNYGVYGTVASTDGNAVAVYGNNTGDGDGVVGTSSGRGTGAGVWGSYTGTANSGYGGYFANTSTTGANFGVYGTVASTSGGAAAVYGNNAAGSGNGAGVWGTTNSTGSLAAAVYGNNTAGSGSGVGVWGTTNSTGAGTAIYGSETGAANTGYAGYFTNTATSGANYAVYGTAASGSGYGGYFTNSSTGWALSATGTSYFNGNVGIGTASPTAQLQVVNGSAGTSYALSATNSGAANTGYAGYFTNTATSGANYGVYGTDASSSGYGGYFVSSDASGGGSGIGVYGRSGGGNGIGVIGESTNNIGVEGYLPASGNGVVNGVGIDVGVAGIDAYASSGAGVYGSNTVAANEGYAGYFTNTGTGAINYGVYGSDASSTGYGGYFTNSGAGWAIAAAGTSYFNGYVGIGTTSPGALLDVGLAGTTTGTMRLEGGASGYVQVQPSGAAGSWTMTLPSGAGSNGYVLSTNGSGVTSWVSASSVVGGTALSAITSATGPSTIDSGANAQTWEWGALSSGTAMTLTTSSMQGGTLLSLQNTAAASTSTGDVLSVTNGSTGAGYGVYSAMTATSNTGYAGYFGSSSTGAGYALYATATGAANTGYAGYFANASGGGWGIYALETTSTGTTGSTGAGAAIYAGENNNVNDATAVYATNNSPNGYAVTAINTSTTGFAAGIYAGSASNSGIGIYSSGSTGVQGNAGGGGSGVYGHSTYTGAGGAGISGDETGAGNTGYAGWFSNTATTNNYGVYATTASTGTGFGLYAAETGAANTGYAGYFTNTATSGANYAVYGTAASGSGYGGYFTNTSTGWALAATGTSYFNGYVGIGTASPGALLDIEGSANVETIVGSSNTVGTSFELKNTTTGAHNVELFTTGFANSPGTYGFYDATTSQTTLAITSSGYVGIGTSAPTEFVDIYSTNKTVASTDGNLFIRTSDPQAADVGGSIILGGNDDPGSEYRTFANISGRKENGTSGNYAGYLAFATRPNGSVTAEAMRITSTGSVGIGTTSPGSLFDIGLAGTTTGTMRLEGGASGYVQLQPAGAAGSWTMTLPSGAGSNGYVLSTNGSGVTSWVSASSVVGGTALSALTSSQATNNIDNAAYGQTWTWNSLSSGTGMTLSSSSATTGNLMVLANTSTAASGDVLNILSSTTSNGMGIYSAMTATGNSGYAGYFANTSTTNTGYALYATNTGAGYALGATGTSTFNGNVGIGTTSPFRPLDVYSGSANSRIAVDNAAAYSAGFEYYNNGSFKWVSYNPTGSNDLRFYDTADRITFQTGGNVGIGTTSPSDLLDVNGAIGLTTTTATAPAVGMYSPSANALTLTTTGSGNITLNLGSASGNIAAGYAVSASGGNSVALGYGTNAYGSESTAMGYGSTASGFKSTAMGSYTTASGYWSTAMGQYTTAASYDETVIGQYNALGASTSAAGWVATDPVFEIGIGSTTTSTADAMVVLKNGDVGIGTTAPANQLDVNGGAAVGSYAGSAGLSNGLVVSGNVGLGTNTAQTGYELTTVGGIYGTQTSSSYAGVNGTNTSVSGTGYGGYFTAATTGAGFGTYSLMNGTGNTGYAGYFTNTSTGVVNYGLYASTSSASGWAGYFQGAVNVAGNITVTSCTGCVAGTSSIYLGSATTANPSISGHVTSGFYTPDAANQVAVESNGIEVMQFNTLGSGTDYLSLTPGKSGTAMNLTTTGSANAALTIATLGSGNITLTPGASGSIVLGSTTYPLTVTANNLLYAGSANTVTGLATANNGVLVTSAGGVPSISSTIPNGTQLNITALGTVTTGTWNAGTVTVPYGGTGATSFTANGVVLGNGTSALGVTATGATNTILQGGGAAAPSFTANPTVGSINVNGNTIPANGMYLSAANTLDFATNTGKKLELTSGGNLNIVTSSAALQLGGTNVLTYPDSGADTSSFAVGAGALASETATGLGNVAFGYNALTALTTASQNTGLGYQALTALTTGTGSNTALGYQAGTALKSGGSNILIGALNATNTLSTGSNNILIGNSIDTAASNTSNTLNIGSLIYGNLTGLNVGIGAVPSNYATLDLSSQNTDLALPGNTSGTAGRPTAGHEINGMIRYNGDTPGLEAFVGGSWQTLLADTTTSSSSNLYLGSATTANPAISGEPTSGFYTSAANTIDVEANGTKISEWTTGGEQIANGNLTVTNGTATAQSFTPTSSTRPTNGLYLPAANSLALSTSGSTALTVSTTGYVGIGTTSPASQLDVEASQTYAGYFNNTGTTANYAVYAASATTTNGYGVYGALTATGNSGYAGYFANTSTTNTGYALYATNTGAGYALGATGTSTFNGNVGIGTTTPTGILDVEGGTAAASTSGTNIKLYAQNGGSSGGVGGNIVLSPGTSGGGGPGSVIIASAVQNGNLQPALDVRDGTGGFVIGGDSGTRGSLTTNTNKFGLISVPHYSNSQTPFALIVGRSSNGTNDVSVGGSTGSVDAATQIDFWTAANGTTATGTEAMIITSTGSVGIGTASPGALLDVGLAGTTTGTMRLEGGTSGYVQLQPSGAAGSWTMTLPSGAGSNGYVLSTNGSGVTSWVANGAGSTLSLSALTSATTTNSIDNANYAQTWKWGTLSTETALTLTTSSMTTGNLLSLSNSAAAANAGTVLNVTTAEAGASYGIQASNTGSTNTGYGVYASNTSSTGYAIYCNASNAVGCGGNQNWYNSSDRRLKDEIEGLAPERGLQDIMKLRPVTYHWKDKKMDQRTMIGLIAQEVEPYYPEAVGTNADGMKSIAYSDFVMPLIKAVQQQQAEIEQIEENPNARNDTDWRASKRSPAYAGRAIEMPRIAAYVGGGFLMLTFAGMGIMGFILVRTRREMRELRRMMRRTAK